MISTFFYNLLVALVVWLPGHSLAVAIIIITLIVRFALLIPNKRAMESQKKIQALQPQIDEVRKTITDQQEQAKALMDLYQKNSINPLGSCFPLLIQIPIMFGLFYALRHGFNTESYKLLYHFVPQPTVIHTGFFWINLANVDKTMILAALACAAQLIQTFLMVAGAKKQGQKMPGSTMLFAMAFLTFLIAKQVNAGVVLYWVISTIFGIFQQVGVNKERLKVVGVETLGIPQLEPGFKAGPSESTSSKKGVEITVRRPGQK